MRENRITTYQTPDGHVAVHDDILGRTWTMHISEAVEWRRGANPYEYLYGHILSRRKQIITHHQRHICWRLSILGEYARKHEKLLADLMAATPVEDDLAWRHYDYNWCRPPRDYHQMDFSKSAELVYGNKAWSYNQYKMHAALTGCAVYTEEEFAAVRCVFELEDL